MDNFYQTAKIIYQQLFITAFSHNKNTKFY